MLELALTRSLAAALCGLLALPEAAAAADGESTPLKLADSATKAASEQGGGGAGAGALVRTIVGLVVVIGVIYGVAWVLKQVKSAREGEASGTADLQPLATLPLGPGNALHLVRTGTEVVLLGVGEKGVTPVRAYSLEEARRLGILTSEDDGADGGDGPDLPGGLLTAPARRRRWLDELRARTVIR